MIVKRLKREAKIKWIDGRSRPLLLLCAALMWWSVPFFCQADEHSPETIEILSGLGLRNPSRPSRRAFVADPVQALICRGQFRLPLAGRNYPSKRATITFGNR